MTHDARTTVSADGDGKVEKAMDVKGEKNLFIFVCEACDAERLLLRSAQ